MGLGEQRVAPKIRTVEDARRLARRRVPRVVFDYIDGAAETEGTMRANRSAVEAVTFVPRMAATAGAPAPDLATTVLGHPVAMPLLVSPVGFTRGMDPAGDIAGARAAAAAGTVFTLSSMSGHTMEDVASAYRRGAGGMDGAWFQLYKLGGRPGAEQLVERAQRAGYSTLVLTVDTQIPGNRERDLRHNISIPLRMDRQLIMRFAARVVIHPRWLIDAAMDRFPSSIMNATDLGEPGHPMTEDEALINWVLSPLDWDDFAWIRELWHGPIVAKGVLTGDDARRSVDLGAAAIVVSNHGGRQLDGAPATMPALVEVLDAVGDRVEVLVDGGIRRGSDVVRAVALGARAAMVGRPWAYGLAAAGEPGVAQVLSILRNDMDRTLRLLGCPSMAALDRSYVKFPAEW
jgi:isopentenyl diphosphate isomerase/L-lactate dehydrogenase-like FMN-dependent dehydrogenase